MTSEPYLVALQGSIFCIAPDMVDAITRYIEHGIPPGDFLQAVICNDLKEAVGCADHRNIGNLPAFVEYFYNHAPMDCWGSRENMEVWIERKAQERKGETLTPEEEKTDE